MILSMFYRYMPFSIRIVKDLAPGLRTHEFGSWCCLLETALEKLLNSLHLRLPLSKIKW